MPAIIQNDLSAALARQVLWSLKAVKVPVSQSGTVSVGFTHGRGHPAPGEDARLAFAETNSFI